MRNEGSNQTSSHASFHHLAWFRDRTMYARNLCTEDKQQSRQTATTLTTHLKQTLQRESSSSCVTLTYDRSSHLQTINASCMPIHVLFHTISSSLNNKSACNHMHTVQKCVSVFPERWISCESIVQRSSASSSPACHLPAVYCFPHRPFRPPTPDY